jgi:hypothetical protein
MPAFHGSYWIGLRCGMPSPVALCYSVLACFSQPPVLRMLPSCIAASRQPSPRLVQFPPTVRRSLNHLSA